jgi:hypothetical protein
MYKKSWVDEDALAAEAKGLPFTGDGARELFLELALDEEEEAEEMLE